jgi:hypothetical protein
MRDLFDAAEANQLKKHGMDSAANAKSFLLSIAQNFALELARYSSVGITSDDVAQIMKERGYRYEDLKNASGSIFTKKHFVWTGRVEASSRPSSHGRMIKVWRINPEY